MSARSNRLCRRAIGSRVSRLIKVQKDISWKEVLTAWDLAVTAARHSDDPVDYRKALDQLPSFGVDVSEALEFAEFCLANPISDTLLVDEN